MELPIRDAKARLSELVTAARKGERVIITMHGRPTAGLVRCDRRGGIDFDKLEAARRRLGIEIHGEG
ncbi:MAG: type II toxin-antitoxin system prevent-host-death family antitoxin [Rhodospirillaceae bacterium]|nr:type II toxin-antitoxin system prevent-host-death family antitoxin [Rhodospirillaceae bacterium]